MSVLSVSFLFLYGICLVVYWILPERLKNGFLLAVSWVYLCTWKWIYLIFLIFVIAVSFFSAKLIVRDRRSGGKLLSLTGAIIMLTAVLVLVKYTTLFPAVLGISFFTFQGISYLVDVYRGDVEEEKNFVVYALYVSFFPQLLSGPIAKAKDQIARYKQIKTFDLERMERGWVTALYGCFLKLVVADRIAVFVNHVYGNICSSSRASILLCILLYSIQIYCDFSGYSLIALGIGKTFGVDLPVNFRQPYCADSIHDFWKRWHISLTSWFRDYVYFPLGGNRKGTFRTYINILIVFIISGIWHGVGLTFVLWGLFHGLLQVIERAFPKRDHGSRCLTFLLVSILWVLFRSENIGQAMELLRGVLINANGVSLTEITGHGLNIANLVVLFAAMLVMLAVDMMQYRGANLMDRLFEMKLPMRWMILYALLFSVIVVGVYGPGYDAAKFIYSKF